MWKKKEGIYTHDFFSAKDDNEVDVEGEEEEEEEVGHMNLVELLFMSRITQWVFLMQQQLIKKKRKKNKRMKYVGQKIFLSYSWHQE